MHVSLGSLGGQRGQNPLELELQAVLNHLMLDAGDWTLKEQQVLSATEPPLQPHPILVFNNKSSHNFLATLFLKCSIACPLCYLLLISKNRNGLVHCCLNSDRVHGTRFLKCWDGMLAPRCLAGIKYIVSVLRGWCLSKPQQAVYKIYCQQKTAEASQRWLFPPPSESSVPSSAFPATSISPCRIWGINSSKYLVFG